MSTPLNQEMCPINMNLFQYYIYSVLFRFLSSGNSGPDSADLFSVQDGHKLVLSRSKELKKADKYFNYN